MGFLRQSKIAGYQLGKSLGLRPTPSAKRRQAARIAKEAKAMSKKYARKAKIHRGIGKASQTLRSALNKLRK